MFIILASYSGCDRVKAVACFIASMAFMAGFYSSVKINAMDIAPNYAGTCSAFVNGLAAVSGMVTPYMVGLLTPDVSISSTDMDLRIWNSFLPKHWDFNYYFYRKL